MTMRRRSQGIIALAAAGLLALTACTAVSPTTGPTDGPVTIKTGAGVTTEACPAAVNPSNGCIYLGVLSDLTDGPFAALAGPITDAQELFWAEVNKNGGISGFDVDTSTYKKDTHYQASVHAAEYAQIAGSIAAISQSLGTVNTEAVLPDMITRSLVTVPTSWWSGYAFEDYDKGIILETGYSYCTEAIVGLDWWAENNKMPTKVASVGYPGDYGGDSAEGVKRWAEANNAEVVAAIGTGPNQLVGDQSAVVGQLLQSGAEVVVLAVGPAETAQIVGGLAANGFTGQFLGSLPTWNHALLASAAAPALKGLYKHMSPYQNWGESSKGMDALKAALGADGPVNGGTVIGWVIGYPMKAALEAAAKAGDLTPQGIAAVVNGLTVDFEGMIPNFTYGGNPQSTAVQAVNIGQPSDVELGLTTISSFYTGPTFNKTSYTSACVASS